MKRVALIFTIAAAVLTAGYFSSPAPISGETQVVSREGDRAPASLSEAPALAKVEEKDPPAVRLQGFSAALEELQSCYGEARDCGFPRTDERSYDFAVGQAIRSQLFEMKEWVDANHIQDSAVSEIARAQLASEDGHVQEAAIALLATQPASEENLDALLEHVIGGYDAQLIKNAMNELERYKSDDDRTKIAVSLTKGMTSGSPFVAKEISADVRPFVQSVNISVFDTATVALPEGSTVKDNLEAALKDYREKQ